MAKTKQPRKPQTNAADEIDKARNVLLEAIEELGQAREADSWKGGGDPHDVPLIEAELELAKVRVTVALDKFERTVRDWS